MATTDFLSASRVNAGYLQQITDIPMLALHKIELLLENDLDVFIYESQPNAQYHIHLTHGDKTTKCVIFFGHSCGHRQGDVL